MIVILFLISNNFICLLDYYAELGPHLIFPYLSYYLYDSHCFHSISVPLLLKFNYFDLN